MAKKSLPPFGITTLFSRIVVLHNIETDVGMNSLKTKKKE